MYNHSRTYSHSTTATQARANSITKIFRGMLVLLALTVLIPYDGQSQAVEPMIRTAFSPDSNLYVYHTFKVPVGYGTNIYRKSEGGTFKQLNDRPVQGAQNALKFRSMVSEYMDRIMESLEIEDPNFAFHRLRADRITANLVTFYYPDVARALGRLYVDSTATPGRSYTYKIKIVDSEGTATQDSLVKTVQPTLNRPDPPTGLEAEHQEENITLYWNYPTTTRVTDDKVVRFRVYQRRGNRIRQLNENPIVRINNFNEFNFDFTAPATGDTLELFVTAINIATLQSEPSEALSYYVADNTPPSVVSNLEANAQDDGTVELTWPVHTEQEVEGYHVYRSRDIQNGYQRLTDHLLGVLDPFYVDRPPETQQTYYYRVTALDSAGNESDSSNSAMANVKDLSPPPTPTDVQVQALNSDSVRISWQMPRRTDDFKTFYVIRRQLGRFSGPAVSQLNDEDLEDTVWVDKGEAGINLADGGRYKYGVLSADSARNFSDTVYTRIKIPDLTAPDPPTRVLVDNDEGLRAIVRWNQSVSLDVTHYRLYRRSAAPESDTTLLAHLPRKRTTFQDTGVVKGNRYVYAVLAVDSLGNAGDTTSSSPFLMRDYRPPRKVYNPYAQLSGDSLIIRWDPVTAPDLKGYRIYRSEIPTGVPEPVTKEAVSSSPYIKTGVDTAEYWYRIRAVDGSGNEGTASDAVRPRRE